MVREALDQGAVISAANLTEVLEVLSRLDGSPGDYADRMDRAGLLHSALLIEEFTYDDSIEAARLRPLTRHLGLSLADRACLALASRMEFPVLTADQAWAQLELGIDIRVIR
jgi:PIN domain nuclease of toxin-antitoxin system